MNDTNDDWSRFIIDTCSTIFDILGRGYPECVYQKAFECELRLNGVAYESEKIIPITYKNTQVGYGRADNVINNEIVVEFKSVVASPKLHEIEQIKHYMKYLNIDKGIIVNFGQPSINQRRSIDYLII